MSKASIFKGWSLSKIARFIAYLTERACANRPHLKFAEETIERCHQAANGPLRRPVVQWAYDADTLGDRPDPFWQLLGSASAIAYWTVAWKQEKRGSRDQREIAEYGLHAAEVALQRAKEIVGIRPIAEVYLNMQYQSVPLDYRDAAIAAFSVDHIEVADEIMQRAPVVLPYSASHQSC